MYANVVVLTYQSPDIATYIYEIPKELENQIKVGHIVSVPFGRRNPQGIVLSTRTDLDQGPSLEKVKPIISIDFPSPILTGTQIKLLHWMANYYHASPINCLEAIIPDIPKRLTSIQGPSLIKDGPFRPTINQTLVLVPTINRIPEVLGLFKLAKNYTLYHGEQKPYERFNTWLKILSGSVDVVFGSRSAIFAPCPNLKKIVIFDEHDGAYKDERSPYYDTLTIAEKLSQIAGAELEIIDAAPKIATYFAHKNIIKTPQLPAKVKAASLVNEKALGNRSPISTPLAVGLEKVFAKGGKSLLFLNKKKESGHLYCHKCKHQEYLPKKPKLCPNCKSEDFYFSSLNIDSLAKEVKKLIPKANVNLIADKSNYPSTPPSNHPTIDIATSRIFYSQVLQKYDLVADIATDHSLNFSDYCSAEIAYQQIINLKKLSRNLLILQTFNPGHFVIKAATENNYEEYVAFTLKERQALKYPPYSLMIKLTLKGKVEATVERKADQLFEELITLKSSLITNHLPLLTILGPYKSFFSKNTTRYNIILKIPVENYGLQAREGAVKNAQAYLEKVPRDWQIVIEPSSLN